MRRRVAPRYRTWLCYALALWLALTSAPLLAQADAGSAAPARTFRDYGQGDLTARTMVGSVSYYFPLPAHRVPVAGSELELVYSHSPLLEPSRSTMTVWVNGQALDSVWLTPANQERARLTVPLPVYSETTPFDAEGYFVQVRFYLRLTLDECEEFNNPAQWATIHGDSQLRLVTAPAPTPPGLEEVERLLAPLTGADPLPTLVLPADPSPAELDAAGVLAYQLGRWAARVGADAPITVTHDLADVAADAPAVMVAAGTRLAAGATWGDLTWDGATFTGNDARSVAGAGILALTTDPAPRLLVSGDDDGVVLAAHALVDPQRRALLTGAHALVRDDEALADLPQPPGWREGVADFRVFGVDTAQRVVGHGEHVLDFYHQRPPGWELRMDSKLTLDVAAAAALRPESSWIAVAVNGLEIGSQPLRGGDAQRYTFDLPVDALNATPDGTPVRDLHARVRLMLDLPHRGCESVEADAAQAAVNPDSMWQLAYAPASGLDLGRFPWPLRSEDAAQVGGTTLVALPDAPSAAELAAGLQMMAALGRWSGVAALPVPTLVTAGALDEATRNAAGIIAVGSGARNGLTAALGERNSALREVPAAPVTQLGTDATRATLHLVQSPWNRDRAVLVVAAADAAGLHAAAASLSGRAVIQQLRGQVAALTGDSTAQVLLDVRPASAIPFSPQMLREISPWQVVAVVLLVAMIAVLAILVMAFRRRIKKIG